MNEDRKRTLLLFKMIVVMFFLFSFFLLFNKDNKKESLIKENINSSISNNNSNAEKSDLEDITNVKNNLEEDIKNITKDIVTKFVKSYHLISKDNNINRLNAVKNLIIEPLYLDLEDGIKLEEEMPKNGYVYRSINDIEIVDFKKIDDTSIMWNAYVWSDWKDENENITQKNIMTDYKLLLVNIDGNWKIGQLSLENI